MFTADGGTFEGQSVTKGRQSLDVPHATVSTSQTLDLRLPS